MWRRLVIRQKSKMAVAKMKGDIARLLSIFSVMPCHVMTVILDLIKTGIAPFDSQTQKTPGAYPINRTWSESDHPLRRYGHSNFDISQGVHLRPPILGEGEVIGGYRSYHSKERWQFPTGSPVWPLRYLWEFEVFWHRMSATLRSTGEGGPFWIKILGSSLWNRFV